MEANSVGPKNQGTIVPTTTMNSYTDVVCHTYILNQLLEDMHDDIANGYVTVSIVSGYEQCDITDCYLAMRQLKGKEVPHHLTLTKTRITYLSRGSVLRYNDSLAYRS